MIELRAPAKLTWFLEITGRRDDGLHELRSEMVTLDFGDRLVVDDDEDYVRVEGLFDGVPLDATNVVARALSLVGRRAGVTITKCIPPGGGLGGGSADAGAILRWAGGVELERALELGSDVPFCQVGGRALVEGIGERVTALEFLRREVTLVLTNLHVATADVYRAFDEFDADDVRTFRNHLEPAARRVSPRLARTMDWLRATQENPVHLAGSGSTLFIEGHLRDDAEAWRVEGPEGFVQFRQTFTTPSSS